MGGVKELEEKQSGFIALFRKFREWEWYKNTNTKVVFIELLLTANFKEGRFEGHEVPKGSVVTSVSKIAQATGLSQSEVRTALKHLILTNEIANTTTSKFSIISIKKWNEYQEVSKQFSNQLAGDEQTISNQLATIEQCNNVTREKSNNVVVEEIVQEFNSRCKSFDRIETTTETAIMNIARLNNMYPDFDYKAYFDRIEKSDFLSGRNGRWNIGRCATFGWLTNPKNVAKVLRGQYDNREEPPTDTGGYDEEF